MIILQCTTVCNNDPIWVGGGAPFVDAFGAFVGGSGVSDIRGPQGFPGGSVHVESIRVLGLGFRDLGFIGL